MNNNRREFLKLSGLAGLGIAGSGLLGGCATAEQQQSNLAAIEQQAKRKHTQRFNMSGYRAPKLDKVRIGFVGLGMRGPGAVNRMSRIEGVEIMALCDLIPERAEAMKKKLQEAGTAHNPTLYSGREDSWKEMCLRTDIDLIYITTPWHLHTPIAVYAMEHDKHAATEVPAAVTMEECWQLVETSERTRKHCMMLENCCYDFFEILTLNMARQGYFGEIIHGEGAYIHQLVDLNFSKEGYQDMWRLKENLTRNGNLYPTHGLGPICQIMNINRGDVMDYLTAVQSDDFQMFEEAKKRAASDPFYDKFEQDTYRGNMNTTSIRTKKGRTMMIQHDVTSPRPYSRIHLVSGTKGMARKWPEQKLSKGHEGWLSEQEVKALEEQYTPEIVQKIGEMAKKIGGHGGMDFMMDWRLIDCLRNGLPLDQDVYDAASWTAVGLLSEWSVANRSNSIDVPDFTAGAWQTNAPVSLSLAGGGTTNVIVQ
ncbi:Gfo/Idh/MocA family protein [Pontibacter russatus]|uniref:Gfo/Idh/MocA family protein n=1 Tax=Pontibacter russatus TaxID=2694929 RepID=UPI00137957FD|nr:Gfo/Idh/MocA family oxidoreductase [Pontibacter russatus]